MKNLADNHLVRFTGITKKKDGLYVNFRAKGIKGGATYSATISVDLSATEVCASDSLEKIIEACAPIAIKEFKKSDFQFEGIQAA